MKKKLFFFLAILILLLSLSACTIGGDGSGGGDNDNNGLHNDSQGNPPSGGNDDGSGGAIKEKLTLVYRTGDISSEHVGSLKEALSGYDVKITSEITLAEGRKIIIGNHADTLSAKAEKSLGRIIFEAPTETLTLSIPTVRT